MIVSSQYISATHTALTFRVHPHVGGSVINVKSMRSFLPLSFE